MSRPAERRGRRDAGFAMVEVVVAIGILGTLIVATLPAVLGGIRGNDHARMTTQAKSLALAELERMRNLPFHVAPDAGDFIDVLDRYYRDLAPPASAPTCADAEGRFTAPTTASSGYVTGADRCPWEPAGALYRTVRTDATDPDLDGFVVVVDTQFLTDAAPPTVVTPPSGWTTQTVGKDTPPASQVGVTVTVFPERRAVRRPLSSYTQISRTRQAATRVTSRVDVTALAVGTSVRRDVEVPLSVTAGLVRLATRLTYASSASALLSAVSGGLGTGDAARGATSSAQAPPSGAVAGVDQGDGNVPAAATCDLACWGGTHVVGGAVSSSAGLPSVGSPTSPLATDIKEPTIGGTALRVGAGSGAAYRDELGLVAPVVRMKAGAVGRDTGPGCTVVDSGPKVRVGASGWLHSTAPDSTGSMRVETCGTARTSPVSVLTTDFAPDGVVRVQLVGAAVQCVVSGAGHTPSTTVDYEAVVERWTPGGYVPVATITEATTGDVLAGVDLATTPVGTHGFLGDWIEGWSNVTPARIARRADAGVASVTLPGVVSLRTVPLRQRLDDDDGDDDGPTIEPVSTLSVTVGAVSCTAEDAR